MKPPAARGLRGAARVLCAAALLCGAAAGAAAQTVYRCGPDGRTYQDEPCAGGRPVEVADPRTDEQRRAAARAAASDERLAARLERERRAREASQAARNAVTVVVPPPPRPASATASRPGWRHPVRRSVRYAGDGTTSPIYRTPPAPRGDRGR